MLEKSRSARQILAKGHLFFAMRNLLAVVSRGGVYLFARRVGSRRRRHAAFTLRRDDDLPRDGYFAFFLLVLVSVRSLICLGDRLSEVGSPVTGSSLPSNSPRPLTMPESGDRMPGLGLAQFSHQGFAPRLRQAIDAVKN